ncbi:DUF7518 family protein [Halegenticoccus tardaugens]|uniref:DUF7518 family protein n=1 Tax=Halegenticoccus tardaugens TaxID=2071624 RepID=UPI00100B938D
MSNRVEELESKVSELRAAVDGLTEELVETKERVRQLEDEVAVDVDAPAEDRIVDAESPTAETEVEGAKADDDEGEDNGATAEESDIIVA